MKACKAGWRYYFFLIFFAAASVLGMKVIWMLLNGEVMDDSGDMSAAASVSLSILIGIAFSTYVETAVMMLWQVLRFDGCLLEINQNGIENTLVFVNILAIVLVVPVKRIPWEAVTYTDFDDDPYIRVNTKKVRAGRLAKLLLMIMGYQFCLSFVKPKVTCDEVKCYEHRFSVTSE